MILPPSYVVNDGRRYRIVAQFEDTAAGRMLANRAILRTIPGASVLCVRDGWIFLASCSDKGNKHDADE